MASEEKQQINVRLTPTAKRVLRMLTDVYGTAQGDVIEMLLRVEAARLKLKGHENSPLRRGLPNAED